MNIINLKDSSGKLYFVGGVVRDELLGCESLDIDVVYEGNAIEYCAKFGQVVQENPDFGTVRVNIDGQIVDFASTRCEKYDRPGHLPTMTFIGCGLEEDAIRRDFTINAMYKSVSTGEIVDFFGGRQDLKDKKIRVLHDNSFIDDPTRIIRALKFATRFGFELGEHTKKLQDEYLANVNYNMCYKRIKKELQETLTCPKAFEEFLVQGIYRLVTPNELQMPINLGFFEYNFTEDIQLWFVFTALLRDLSRLELTRQEQKIIDDFEKIEKLDLYNDFLIYKAFENTAIETVIIYWALKNEKIAKRYLRIKDIKLEVTGEDLKTLGIEPSPKYSEIFDKILEKKLENPSMTKDEELILVNLFN